MSISAPKKENLELSQEEKKNSEGEASPLLISENNNTSVPPAIINRNKSDKITMSNSFIGFIEPFVPGGDFPGYKDRMDQFFICNKVSNELKAPLFITMCGAEVYELCKKLTTPQLPSQKTYGELMKILSEYYQPKRNKRSERYKFFNAMQEEGETISDYIVRLKFLSQECEFGDFITNEHAKDVAYLQQKHLNEELLDQLIRGLRSERIQQKLMDDLTSNFDKACEIALQLELTKQGQIEMRSNTVNSLKNESNGNREKHSSQKKSDWKHKNQKIPQKSKKPSDEISVQKFNKCKRCGRKHDEKKCPAVNWECFKCKRKGHTSSVCTSESIKVINNIHGASEACYVTVNVNKIIIEMEVDSQKILECGSFIAEVCHRNVVVSLKMSVVNIGKRFKPLMGRPWLDKLFSGWRKRFETNIISLIEHNDIFDNIRSRYPNIVDEKMNEVIRNFEVDLVLQENKTPVFHAAYTVPFKLREKVGQELERLCKEEILEPVQYSQWASPVVIVAKPNGEIRICLDGKASLNKCLEFAHYPLPLVEDIFAEFANCKYFSVIDLKGAYQQLKLSNYSKKILVVNTQNGLYAYKRLTFGVNCAASIFQSVMDQILNGLQFVRAFQDDIIIGGLNQQQAIENVYRVCDRLSKFNVKINIEKCRFLKTSVEYLGHCLTDGGVKPNPNRVKAIHQTSENKHTNKGSTSKSEQPLLNNLSPSSPIIVSPNENRTVLTVLSSNADGSNKVVQAKTKLTSVSASEPIAAASTNTTNAPVGNVGYTKNIGLSAVGCRLNSN
ncbi:uncharacterized protein K02A2.6-like [Anastrepha ludens]|uniref:uncharacterized protein K02A2.6-like n=1 Tax=Anastrepha ludens TaxID=28586 RepID=UPI0023B16B32|nr:uncharacterized protein K02A2.6-like [Anastrepha ludens]